MEKINVLLIEDNISDARYVEVILKEDKHAQFCVHHADRLMKGIALLKEGMDIILLDLGLPCSQGIETFIKMYPYATEVPIVILSGLEDKKIALDAVKLGAQDYIVKGVFDQKVLGLALLYAIARHKFTKSELAREAAMEKVRVKSLFLANMSHEIRTPMYGIIGTLDLLKKTTLSNHQRECIEILDISSNQLLKLLNDILDFSMIEANRLAIYKSDFNLKTLVREVITLCQPMAEAKKLYLRFHVNEDVPILLINYDLRIKQVLINLISNAIKFTEKGGITIEVTKGEECDERVTICVAVKDTGIGIAEKDFQNLFQSFSQINAAMKNKYCGAGLGLAISKKLVEMMKGRISVESTVGVGSIFSFEIPCDKQKASLIHIKAGECTEEDLSVRSFKNIKILVAEDNLINQKVILLQLVQLGLQESNVTIASDGFEALHLVKQNSYDLILMDCQMPQMDGYKTSKQIREIEGDGKHVPIIAITAYALSKDREKCLSAGMSDYIGKPVKMSDLKAVIVRYVLCENHPKDPESQADPEEFFHKLAGGNEKHFHELLQMYCKHLQADIEKLCESLENGRLDEVAFIAHKCFGSSSTLGFSAIADIFNQINSAVKEQKISEVQMLSKKLVIECEKIKRNLS